MRRRPRRSRLDPILVDTGCVAAGPAQFLLHANESKKHVYIVFTEAKTFDWGSIPHYNGYIGGRPDPDSRGSASEAQ